ncbi:MAG: heme exporter protein CcmD [Coriobacteriia bacterium]
MIETATNAELYKLVLADAPYVIAAYGVLWAALVVFVGMTIRRIMRLERQVRVLEESIDRRG